MLFWAKPAYRISPKFTMFSTNLSLFKPRTTLFVILVSICFAITPAALVLGVWASCRIAHIQRNEEPEQELGEKLDDGRSGTCLEPDAGPGWNPI